MQKYISNPTYNPRYIHVHGVQVTKKHSGFTVAYIRTEAHLFFAFSLVNKNDIYSKSTGRDISKNRLEDYISDMDDTKSYVDFNNNTGVLRLKDMVHDDVITSMLGDHAIIRLTMMDFKHAYLSSRIKGIIYSHLSFYG